MGEDSDPNVDTVPLYEQGELFEGEQHVPRSGVAIGSHPPRGLKLSMRQSTRCSPLCRCGEPITRYRWGLLQSGSICCTSLSSARFGCNLSTR